MDFFSIQGNKQKTLEKLQTENVNLYVANDSITDAIQVNFTWGYIRTSRQNVFSDPSLYSLLYHILDFK